MKYKEVIDKLIKNKGDCIGISCPDCPFSDLNNYFKINCQKDLRFKTSNQASTIIYLYLIKIRESKLKRILNESN